jgi:hypothetical protein
VNGEGQPVLFRGLWWATKSKVGHSVVTVTVAVRLSNRDLFVGFGKRARIDFGSMAKRVDESRLQRESERTINHRNDRDRKKAEGSATSDSICNQYWLSKLNVRENK